MFRPDFLNASFLKADFVRAVLFKFCIALFLAAAVAGCSQPSGSLQNVPHRDGTFSSQTGSLSRHGTQADGAYTANDMMLSHGGQAMGVLKEPVRVAILAPTTGPNAQLGEALMQAAQLAVFDLNETNFQLIPKDTGGTAAGATRAVEEAAREGARLILGPLFAPEVEAAKSAARTYGLNVIGFSTDWRVAGGNAFTMGVLPFEQAQRMGDFAATRGYRNIGVVATQDAYGDAVVNAFTAALSRHSITPATVVRIRPDGSDATKAVQKLTDSGVQFDALFIPLSGDALSRTVSALSGYGMGAGRVVYLGTGLWDDGVVSANPALLGAYYAAPSPQVRAAFERNYQRIYGQTPPRLASIGYDAAALAVVLARTATQTQPSGMAANQGRITFERSRLLDSSGFSGVDGIFRFMPDGRAQRGLAVLQITHGGKVMIIDHAPQSFVGVGQ